VRVKRDILRRSSVGGIFTARSVAQSLAGSNQAYGVDGAFAFFSNLFVNTYWAKTRTNGLTEDDTSYRGQLEYAGDRYGVQVERLRVGDNFNPEIGFLRRDNMRRSFGQFRFSPRPASIKAVRKFSWVGTINYIENGAGRPETRTVDGLFAIDFQTSDRFDIDLSDNYELLTRPFPITPAVTIPTGGYDFNNVSAGLTFGQQRRVSGRLTAERGSFYDGDRTALGWSGSRVNVTPRFSLEPSASINWVDLPYGAFTTRLIGSRVTYTVTPLMFASALIQYNSGSNLVSANVRLRWEYRPGSELFVVFNEERDSDSAQFSDLRNRALIVKVNRLFRF